MSAPVRCDRCGQPGELVKVFDNPGESRSGGAVWWCGPCRAPLPPPPWGDGRQALR